MSSPPHKRKAPIDDFLATVLWDNHNKLHCRNNCYRRRILDLVLDLNYFSFLTQTLIGHTDQTPNTNYQFSQRIWNVKYYSVHAHMAWSQKFRLTPAPWSSLATSRSKEDLCKILVQHNFFCRWTVTALLDSIRSIGLWLGDGYGLWTHVINHECMSCGASAPSCKFAMKTSCASQKLDRSTLKHSLRNVATNANGGRTGRARKFQCN